MQRMRCRRRQRCIASRRRQTPCRDGRIVVAVNDVVSDAGVIWQLWLEPFENRRCTQLARIRIVGQIDCLVEGQRVEHCCLGIVRIACAELRHRGLVVGAARFLIARRMATEERCQRLDPVAFTLRRRTRRACPLDVLPAGSERLRRKRRHQRIRSLTDCDAPVRHRAVWLARSDRLEGADRFRMKEGMQHRHCAIEVLLTRRAAGDREMHAAETSVRRMTGMLALGLRCHACQCQYDRGKDRTLEFHRARSCVRDRERDDTAS